MRDTFFGPGLAYALNTCLARVTHAKRECGGARERQRERAREMSEKLGPRSECLNTGDGVCCESA